MTAVSSSISGYWIEIGARHPRQRPRSTIHETIGTLSYHRSPTPHLGQCDGGRTTDSFGSAPHRRMHTLRKLPITAPNSAATTMKSGMSGVTRDLVQEDTGGYRHAGRPRGARERNRDPAARRRHQLGADPGPFVPHHQGERRAATWQAAERLAVGRGHDQVHPSDPGPVH